MFADFKIIRDHVTFFECFLYEIWEYILKVNSAVLALVSFNFVVSKNLDNLLVFDYNPSFFIDIVAIRINQMLNFVIKFFLIFIFVLIFFLNTKW